MDCECNILVEIRGFGGYSHYHNTLEAMKKNVENGYFDITAENQYEIIFRCKKCKQIWKLGKVDFPVTGYFLRATNL